ncbi:MAG: hypothetical protein WBC55_03590 [Dehalococcoidia bacterium]
MPIVRNIRLSLRSKQLLRREGIKEYSRLRPEIKDTIRELLTLVRRDHLLEPAIAYEIYFITETRSDQLSLDGGVVLHAPVLPAALPGVKELAVVVCTIGHKLERKVTDYSEEGEPLRSLLLDGIGSAAVDSLALEVCKLIAHQASSRDLQASSPLSPGMPGFPISEQWQMMNLVSAGEIGVSLTQTATMIPRKSVSMVIGIGAHMPTWTQAEVCARCSLRKTCPYRVQA